MKKIIFLLAVITVFFTSCNSGGSSSSSDNKEITKSVEELNSGGSSSSSSDNKEISKSPEELKKELQQQEQSSPTDYLTADGTYKENFWGDKLKINCTITNKATIATYKDVIVRVNYYSKTKTELTYKDYTIYEMFPPNSSKTVVMKIDNYKNVNSIGWDVISASSVN